MKKIFSLGIILFLHIQIIFAQLEKNTWLLGGNFNINQQKATGFSYIPIFDNSESKYINKGFNTTSTSSIINFNTNIGYFVMDKLAIGLNLGINYFKDSTDYIGIGVSRHKELQFDYGVFVRYYVLNKEKNFNVPVEISFNYYYNNNAQFYSNTNFENYKKVKIQTGIECFLNRVIGVEFLLGYAYSELEETNSLSTRNSRFIKHDFFMSLGFQIHLSKN